MSGAIRPVGVLVALATAAAVFGIGMLVLPPVEPPPVQVATPPPPPPSPPPAPAPNAADAAGDSPAAPALPEPPAAPARPQASAEPAPAPAEPAAAPAPKAAAAPAQPKPVAAAPSKPEASPTHEKAADKEVARDAWRKNLPDVSGEPGKATMIIPIKGSTEGATYHVTVKPKSVLISLPKAESMITMPFYSVKHDGFRQLWIKKDEESGTSIRVVLGDASDPQVEIKDEFVRVTVRRFEAPTGN
jgi:hypothetical protein